MRLETRTLLVAAYLLQAGCTVITLGGLVAVFLLYGIFPFPYGLYVLPFPVIYLATRLLRAHRTAVITLLVASMVLCGSVCIIVLAFLSPAGTEGAGILVILVLGLQYVVVAFFIVVALVAVLVGRMRNRAQKNWSG